MKICIFTPATASGRSGNWVTASRWQRLLTNAGNKVQVVHDPHAPFQNFDVLVGLHAKRSGRTAQHFKKNHPDRLAMLALTGTDLYRDLGQSRSRRSEVATKALDVCDRVILLQPTMAKKLKRSWREKSDVVMKDVDTKKWVIRSRDSGFTNGVLNVCVVGHLRTEKDPFRAAMATRESAGKNRFFVTHAGAALSRSFRDRAITEMKRNGNYRWVGNVTRAKIQKLMAQSGVLVNSSRMEGAPNVLFEAMEIGLPILASKIDGHVGVLGTHYPGYFPAGDTDRLRYLLLKCRTDHTFYSRLSSRLKKIAAQFKPGSEQRSLLRAISNADSS